MKRPETADSGRGESGPLEDAEFGKRFPTLQMYLSDTQYDDGASRTTSTITLFIEQGQFKVAINDRDLKRSAYISAGTLEEAMLVAERQLATDTAEWRPWGGAKKRK